MYIVGAVEIVLVCYSLHLWLIHSVRFYFVWLYISQLPFYYLLVYATRKLYKPQIFFLQTYMAPWLSIFGDFTKDPEIMYNNFRVYGTGLLLLMGEYYDKDNNNLHFMEELSLLSHSFIFLTSHKIIIFFFFFFFPSFIYFLIIALWLLWLCISCGLQQHHHQRLTVALCWR